MAGHNALRAYLLEAAEAERYYDLAIERHWVSGTPSLAAWHASWNHAADETAKVRQAGFLSAEVGGGRAHRAPEAVGSHPRAPRGWGRRDDGGRRLVRRRVSEFDEQELRNALDQVRREVQQRFDFKGATVELTQAKEEITS